MFRASLTVYLVINLVLLVSSLNVHEYNAVLKRIKFLLKLRNEKPGDIGIHFDLFEIDRNSDNCLSFTVRANVEKIVIKVCNYIDKDVSSNELKVHQYLNEHVNGYPSYVLKPYFGFQLYSNKYTIYRFDDESDDDKENQDLNKYMTELQTIIGENNGVMILVMPKPEGNRMLSLLKDGYQISLQQYVDIIGYLIDLKDKYQLYMINLTLDSIMMGKQGRIVITDLQGSYVGDRDDINLGASLEISG